MEFGNEERNSNRIKQLLNRLEGSLRAVQRPGHRIAIYDSTPSRYATGAANPVVY